MMPNPVAKPCYRVGLTSLGQALVSRAQTVTNGEVRDGSLLKFAQWVAYSLPDIDRGSPDRRSLALFHASAAEAIAASPHREEALVQYCAAIRQAAAVYTPDGPMTSDDGVCQAIAAQLVTGGMASCADYDAASALERLERQWVRLCEHLTVGDLVELIGLDFRAEPELRLLPWFEENSDAVLRVLDRLCARFVKKEEGPESDYYTKIPITLRALFDAGWTEAEALDVCAGAYAAVDISRKSLHEAHRFLASSAADFAVFRAHLPQLKTLLASVTANIHSDHRIGESFINAIRRLQAQGKSNTEIMDALSNAETSVGFDALAPDVSLERPFS